MSIENEPILSIEQLEIIFFKKSVDPSEIPERKKQLLERIKDLVNNPEKIILEHPVLRINKALFNNQELEHLDELEKKLKDPSLSLHKKVELLKSFLNHLKFKYEFLLY